MVGYVKHGAALALCAWCVLLIPAWALGPSEPFVAPRVGQARSQLGQTGSGETPSDGETPAPAGLSGVRLGRQAGAVIDGQWIRKGHTVRGARLVQIQRTRVTLQHPDGHQEVIEMFPPAGGQAGAMAAASTEAAKP